MQLTILYCTFVSSNKETFTLKQIEIMTTKELLKASKNSKSLNVELDRIYVYVTFGNSHLMYAFMIINNELSFMYSYNSHNDTKKRGYSLGKKVENMISKRMPVKKESKEITEFNRLSNQLDSLMSFYNV